MPRFAHADIDFTGLYSGFQYSNSSDQFKSATAPDVTKDRGHLKVKLGKIVNDYLSFEGQLGITSDSSSSQGITTYGAYVNLNKVIDQYKFYGLLGLGGLHAYYKDIADVSESSFSYGVGLEIFGSKDLTVSFEYLSILDTSVNGGDLTFDALGIGFTYYFTEDTSYFNKNKNKVRSIRY